jgi:hypothetical protein
LPNSLLSTSLISSLTVNNIVAGLDFVSVVWVVVVVIKVVEVDFVDFISVFVVLIQFVVGFNVV